MQILLSSRKNTYLWLHGQLGTLLFFISSHSTQNEFNRGGFGIQALDLYHLYLKIKERKTLMSMQFN